MTETISPEPPIFFDIVRQSVEGVLVIDTQGRIRFANPACAALFHRPVETLLESDFGLPATASAETEIDIFVQGGGLVTAMMRVSASTWEGAPALIVHLRDVTGEKHMETALTAANAELRAIYRCSPLALIGLALDWRVRFCNPAAEELLGWRCDEAAGSHFPSHLGMDTLEWPSLNAAVRQGEIITGHEVHLERDDGSAISLSLSLAPLGNVINRTAGILCIAEDITRRARDAERLRLASKILEATQEAIMITDAKGVILSVNRAFTAVTGYTDSEVIGQRPNLLRSGRHSPDFYRDLWESLERTGHWQGEIWNRRKNGDLYPEWSNMSAIHSEDGSVSHYVAVFSDISRVKENEARLMHLAHHDVLTGLPNRFLFLDRAELALTQARRSGRMLGLLFIDLDHFKAVNDSLGHRVGDGLLIAAAQRIKGELRAGDTLSRFGGDELNALLPDLEHPSGAITIAEKLITALAQPFLIEDHTLSITASVGIALFPRDGDNVETLLRAADAAMYEAKINGRNTWAECTPQTLEPPPTHDST